MKCILVLGALPKTPEQTILYETIISASTQFATQVHSPIDTAKFEGSDSERFSRAMELVETADVLIGEQSLPSTGQGVELGVGYTKGKPILVVAKQGSAVSGVIQGCPNVKGIAYYSSLEDLETQLCELLKTL